MSLAAAAPVDGTFALSKFRYLVLSLVILALDQWTKWLVEIHLPPHVSQPIVPGLLSLTHVRNTGVAFGLWAQGGAGALTALGLVALVVVGFYFIRARSDHRLLLVALAMVLGGAVGNLLDRVLSGAVTDFVDVYVGTHHWPAFNVADSAISIGLALMALDALRPASRGGGERPPAED
jgi:signal peptidase II